MRRGIVGIMGSASRSYPELSHPAGAVVARLGFHLLTGGGGGVMAEASRAFCEEPTRRGLCLGILKGEVSRSFRDGREILNHHSSEPNPWVEIPIRTHLPLSGLQGRDPASRNHLNVLSSDVLLVLPGEAGTLSEVTLRLDYGLPLILFLGTHGIAGLPADHFLALAREVGQVRLAGTPEELEALLVQAFGEGELTGTG